MTRAEALEILDLKEGASDDEIRDAHRRLIVRIHPDRGGSTFLAAKLNEARDVLLHRH
jgi:curved DNA-binding protein CbpA